MAFPEKLLAEDEQVVEHLHPHWSTLILPALGFLLCCAGLGTALAFLPTGRTHASTRHILAWALLAAFVLLVCWWTVAPILRWRATHYVITTRRVLIRRGVLNHVGRDITLARINDVAYSQRLLDRMIGAGSLTIESAGEQGQENITNIPHANQVQQTINRLIEADAGRRNP